MQAANSAVDGSSARFARRGDAVMVVWCPNNMDAHCLLLRVNGSYGVMVRKEVFRYTTTNERVVPDMLRLRVIENKMYVGMTS